MSVKWARFQHSSATEIHENKVSAVRMSPTSKTIPMSRPPKDKKFEEWQRAVHGEDWHRQKVLSGNFKKVTKKLPYGKTWLKQLFAGQMGFSLMAIIIGLTIGIPLGSSSSDWDVASNKGHRRVCHDLQVEDPFLTAITQPCGPWGNWSRFNISKGGKSALTVLELREAGRPILRHVSKIITGRIKAKSHVFVEQPLSSQLLMKDELAEVVDWIRQGALTVIRVDGCQVGYQDQESGLPHYKPSVYITSLLTAETVFKDCICEHKHQPLEGNNCFGSRTSVWPYKLNHSVIQAMLQQGSAESTSAQGVVDAFLAEVRPGEGQPPGQPAWRKRKTTGRVSRLTGQCSAPPVYVRPSQPAAPAPLPLQDGDVQEQPQQHLGDASIRASQVAELDPLLNITKAERRRRPELRKILRDLHVQFGHQTNTT
jgi:hypothetical protein